MHLHTYNLTNTSWVIKRGCGKTVCVCMFVYPSVFLQNLVKPIKSCAPFCYGPLPLPHSLFATCHEYLISCPLAHDQPFHKILCKSGYSFGSYVLFWLFCPVYSSSEHLDHVEVSQLSKGPLVLVFYGVMPPFKCYCLGLNWLVCSLSDSVIVLCQNAKKLQWTGKFSTTSLTYQFIGHFCEGEYDLIKQIYLSKAYNVWFVLTRCLRRVDSMLWSLRL